MSEPGRPLTYEELLRAIEPCPRCLALVLFSDLEGHLDWHAGVSDGFHDYVPGDDGRCRAQERTTGTGWGATYIYCGLHPEHWYHQPLPAVVFDFPPTTEELESGQ